MSPKGKGNNHQNTGIPNIYLIIESEYLLARKTQRKPHN